MISGLLLLSGFFLLTGGQSAAAAETASVVGTWEGQSLCTVPNSPCHDEHVIYHIKSVGRDGHDLVISGNKVVNGEEVFMGDLECRLRSNTLSCSFGPRPEDDWEFQVSGKHMNGTLVTGKDRTLFRKISVDKRSD